jgi:flagellar biosynthesis protein FlhG
MTQTESPLINRPGSHPASAAPGRNLITIASGKGGVGKTFMAITLAHAMAREGKKVLLFDGDVGLANVDIQLGLIPEKDLALVIAGQMTLAEAAFPFEDGGFDIIAGRSGSGSLGMLDQNSLAALHKDLIELGNSYDYVILDLGAGIDAAVRILASAPGPKVVITTADPTSLTDAYAFIKVVSQQQPDANLQIAVNMVKSKGDGKKVYDRLKTACQNFLKLEPGMAGIIQQDDKVAASIRAQTALLSRYPTSDVAADFEALARSVMEAAS